MIDERTETREQLTHVMTMKMSSHPVADMLERAQSRKIKITNDTAHSAE